jgi:hypothetical protein
MKAQASLEYLTTHAWSVLILIVVLVLLVSMSFFRPPTPVACLFPITFSCVGFKLTTDGNLSLDVRQSTGHQITVMAFKCTQEADAGTMINTPNITIANNDHALIANGTNFQCLDFSGVPVSGSVGSAYRGKLYIYYKEDDTGSDHIVSGEVSTKYE